VTDRTTSTTEEEIHMETTSATLTPAEKLLNDSWDAHLGAEFGMHDADATITTMVAHPRVNHVPVMTGGDGRDQVHEFYEKHFLHHLPPDLETIPVSRTIGQGRVVDEFVAKFTHTIPLPWLLPGVPPTGKRVEIALVVIVHFEGTKIARENIYWDHASLLVQLGLLDPKGLPVVGVEGTHAVLDPRVPLNALIDRAGAKP
jgi:carboxymethylenebutenolidase